MTEPFDIDQTIASQYAQSPIIVAIIRNAAESIDPTANLDRFYNIVWNIDTAEGWGLDVWGRILGVGRVLQVPVSGSYLGFEGADYALTFGFGVFYGFGTATENFPLSDTAYRRLLLAKAASNITDGSIPSINAILTALFPDYAPVYVRDDGGMEMTYVFGATLSPVDYAIVTQSGALPKPVGVSFTVEQP